MGHARHLRGDRNREGEKTGGRIRFARPGECGTGLTEVKELGGGEQRLMKGRPGRLLGRAA